MTSRLPLDVLYHLQAREEEQPDNRENERALSQEPRG